MDPRGGDGASAAQGLHTRPLVRVTPENVLQFGGLTPTVQIGVEGRESGREGVTFSSLEDFHPDALFRRLAALEVHRSARDRLLSPESEAGREAGPKGESGAGLLDAVLEETEDEFAAEGAGLDDDLDGFIRRVVRPHRVESGPDRTQEVAALDTEISRALSGILHDPGFQSLESLWRSVVFLLSRIEVKTSLRVYLIDVSKSDLVADLLSSDDPTDWSLGGLILNPVSEHGEELRWAGLVGAYTFGLGDEDIPLLQRIGLLAEAAEVPWFSAGDSALLGCDSMDATPEPRDWDEAVDPLWPELRGNPEASWISLAFPAFLLRTPYGTEGRGAKTFAFTESVEGSEDLLWGNPAILCGIGLARAFTTSGWGLRPSLQLSVENVPVFNPEVGWREQEGPGGQEGWASPLRGLLSHSAAARVRDSGLTPVLGARNEAVLRVQGVRTISTGENALRAWWIGST
jgi:hypothetical protein